MNYVVEALKEWRQKQRILVQSVREPLPAELHDAMTGFGNHIWEVAQRLANDALESARAAFEAEKSDLARLSAEQSDAYEALAAEHERTVEEFTCLQGRAAQLEEERSALGEQLRTAQQEAHVAATEIREKAALVDRLEKDLERARADVDGVRAEVTASRRELADEREKASKAEAKHGAEKEREIDALRRHDKEFAQELAGSQRGRPRDLSTGYDGSRIWDLGRGPIDELTREAGYFGTSLLALILRNPGPYQVRIDTVIHRRARYRHARLQTCLYQLALCVLVVFAPPVALRTDYQAALQVFFLFAHVHLSTFVEHGQVASVIQPCDGRVSFMDRLPLNDIDPRAYLNYVLARIADHRISAIDELLPWRVADKLHAPASPPH
ncbi:MAG: Mobile element protein [uncultured Caballeronia sp.]|nr:MAG: Mobile element protein [uncultured Caballeronia sp.]